MSWCQNERVLFVLAALAVACADAGPRRSTTAPASISSGAQLGRVQMLLSDEAGDAASESSWTESCEALDDGGQYCTYDDRAGTSCEVLFSASGDFSYQSCDGDWGSYDCVVSFDATITCELATIDGQHCTDHFSAAGDYLDGTCGELSGGDDGDRPDDGQVPEECTEQSNGTWLCIYVDAVEGYECDALYDADGFLLSQNCFGDGWSYNCVASGSTVLCSYSEGDQLICEDVWNEFGEPVSLGCPWEDDMGSGDPSEPQPEPTPSEPVDECSTSEDGSTFCTFSDGNLTCNDWYDVNGVLIMSNCWTNDCTYFRDCTGDAQQLTCNITGVDGSCTETYSVPFGEIISSTCGGGEEAPAEGMEG